RVWRIDASFVTYHCARCGESGHVLDRSAPPPDPVRLAAARAEATERERIAAAERLELSRWLWRQSGTSGGTLAEVYLPEGRGYGGLLPRTVRFLPARDEHGPAMIVGFGITSEPEPGRLELDPRALTGVHLTRLRADGLGKADGEGTKIMIGRSLG